MASSSGHPTTQGTSEDNRAEHADRTDATDSTEPRSVAIIGLGEVGRTYGTALSRIGHRVTGFDSYHNSPVEGVTVTRDLSDAVCDRDLVLTLTAAAASRSVAEAASDVLAVDAVYADCTSSRPQAKRDLMETFAGRPDIRLADVAILGPVIQLGAATPLMTAGAAAHEICDLMRPMGTDVEVIDGELGDAMAHKLLRSVFMKGLAAAVTEAVRAGNAAGFEPWLRTQIARELAGDGQQTIDRFLHGSVVHAVRRAEEMDAAADYINSRGVPPIMARATAKHLRSLQQTRRLDSGEPL